MSFNQERHTEITTASWSRQAAAQQAFDKVDAVQTCTPTIKSFTVIESKTTNDHQHVIKTTQKNDQTKHLQTDEFPPSHLEPSLVLQLVPSKWGSSVKERGNKSWDQNRNCVHFFDRYSILNMMEADLR